MTSVHWCRAFLRQVVAALVAPTAAARQVSARPQPTHAMPAVDVLPLLLDGGYPLAGDHDLDRVIEGRSVGIFLKFGNQPGPDPMRWPDDERWGWDDRWVYHLEDHPAPDRAYRFRGDRRWLPRLACPGDTFVVDTEMVDYARDADGAWHQAGARPWRYRIRVEQADAAGATGPGRLRWVVPPASRRAPARRRVAAGRGDQRFFASDGWHTWESWKTPAAHQPDERTQHATFDRPRAGRSLRPDVSITGAAWWADLLPPRITITDWTPKRGLAPLRVVVHWEAGPGFGPVEAVAIEYRRLGEERWNPVDADHAGSPSHGRIVTLPAGTFEIRAIGSNAAGRDITARQRLVEVTR